jgi:malonyl CoA-acyl carrier protein transacylase
MKTFVFPGQGSQGKGMGGDLFDKFDELTKRADRILGYSIKKLCHEDSRKELNKTQFTQPALYVVGALAYLQKIEEEGHKPDFVAGHSLGEFNALFAAGCFDFETGLRLVKKRGELMGKATGGAMAAIMNSSKENIEKILDENNLSGIELANFNTSTQIVVSGLREDIGKAQQYFQDGSVLYYPLNTSGAFHSRYMEEAKKEFEEYLNQFQFSEFMMPVISNVTATPYKGGDVIVNLSKQMINPVRWTESVQYLLSKGVTRFEEVGYGDVLTKLIDRIKSDEPAVVEKKHFSDLVSPSNGITFPGNHSLAAKEKVKAWNISYPIGTKVKSSVVNDVISQTSKEAVVLFGHRAAVYLHGYNGYFDLNELEVV